jgi:hypothetical protein
VVAAGFAGVAGDATVLEGNSGDLAGGEAGAADAPAWSTSADCIQTPVVKQGNQYSQQPVRAARSDSAQAKARIAYPLCHHVRLILRVIANHGRYGRGCELVPVLGPVPPVHLESVQPADPANWQRYVSEHNAG